MQKFTWPTIRRIADKQAEEIAHRALIMERIQAAEPIGRRSLAEALELPEREVRKAADALKAEGLITLTASGMQLTPAGHALMPEILAMCQLFSGLNQVEDQLRAQLKLPEVVIVPGDSDNAPHVLRAIGQAVAGVVGRRVKDGMILAVSGGSTMVAVAHAMSPLAQGITVVPARGGFGSLAETQADAVAGEMARHMNAACRLMHLPEGMDQETLSKAAKLPGVAETLRMMRNADMIIFGVGRADETAEKRGLDKVQLKLLEKSHAVGEVLGDFISLDGKVVYRSGTLSKDLMADKPDATRIMAAGGNRKAHAMLAAVRSHPPHVLVIDEGAARAMLQYSKETKSQDYIQEADYA
ncbi:MAG: sugar-binding domain-containing protein [Eubacteriales bacterium]|nr:sugar-binding domain-containing protein [Eubacteriales bacterium]